MDQPKDYVVLDTCTQCGKECRDIEVDRIYPFCSEYCYNRWYTDQVLKDASCNDQYANMLIMEEELRTEREKMDLDYLPLENETFIKGED